MEKEQKELIKLKDDEILSVIARHLTHYTLIQLFVSFWPEEKVDVGIGRLFNREKYDLQVLCSSIDLQRTAVLRARIDSIWFQYLRDHQSQDVFSQDTADLRSANLQKDLNLWDKCQDMLVNGKLALERSSSILEKYFSIPKLIIELMVNVYERKSVLHLFPEFSHSYTQAALITGVVHSGGNDNFEAYIKDTSNGWHRCLSETKSILNPSIVRVFVQFLDTKQQLELSLTTETLWQERHPVEWGTWIGHETETNTHRWKNDKKLDYSLSLKNIEQAIEIHEIKKRIFDFMYNHMNMFEPLSRLIVSYL